MAGCLACAILALVYTALSPDQQYFMSIKTFFSIKLFRLPLEQI